MKCPHCKSVVDRYMWRDTRFQPAPDAPLPLELFGFEVYCPECGVTINATVSPRQPWEEEYGDDEFAWVRQYYPPELRLPGKRGK